jgi:hypothetical protein
MNTMLSSARAARVRQRRPLAALTGAVAVPWLALAPAAMGGTATVPATATSPSTATVSATPIASATLEQCATATIPQTERSATFAGEMTAVAGTARMEIRIDLEERAPGELGFRTVSAPGLGVWHSSAAGVKVFAHIQQVTNLSAPAFYRAAVRFRWLNAKGRLLKSEELRTARCEQPATPAPSTGSTPTSTAPASATTGATTG